MVDARLPDGSRVNAIIAPLAIDGPQITIRKFTEHLFTLDDLVRLGTLSTDVGAFLSACVQGRMNILISGGTGSGKTTLLNVLSSMIPNNERIVTIEDAAELRLRQRHVVRLESRPSNIEGKGEVRTRELVRNALRMRPDRIVVGEVRGAEALDMLQAMNTGHDGSLSTLHANSPRDALSRVETMVLMAGFDLPIRAIREQTASAIDLLVHISRGRDGVRRVTRVSAVDGMEGDVITLSDIFVFEVDRVRHAGESGRPGRRRAAPHRCAAEAGATPPRGRRGHSQRGLRLLQLVAGQPSRDDRVRPPRWAATTSTRAPSAGGLAHLHRERGGQDRDDAQQRLRRSHSRCTRATGPGRAPRCRRRPTAPARGSRRPDRRRRAPPTPTAASTGSTRRRTPPRPHRGARAARTARRRAAAGRDGRGGTCASRRVARPTRRRTSADPTTRAGGARPDGSPPRRHDGGSRNAPARGLGTRARALPARRDRRSGRRSTGATPRSSAPRAPAGAAGRAAPVPASPARAQRGVLHPVDRRARRGAQADGNGDGFVVVEQERREVGAGGEAVPAGRTGGGVDRVAEVPEAVDVTPQRAGADPQALGQLTTGPELVGLEERQELQRPAGGIGHAPIIVQVADGSWPQRSVRTVRAESPSHEPNSPGDAVRIWPQCSVGSGTCRPSGQRRWSRSTPCNHQPRHPHPRRSPPAASAGPSATSPRSTASTSPSTRARSTACSGPTAPASRRRSRCCAPSWPRPAARRRWPASTSSTVPSRCACTSASPSRTSPSTRSRPASSCCASRASSTA